MNIRSNLQIYWFVKVPWYYLPKFNYSQVNIKHLNYHFDINKVYEGIMIPLLPLAFATWQHTFNSSKIQFNFKVQFLKIKVWLGKTYLYPIFSLFSMCKNKLQTYRNKHRTSRMRDIVYNSPVLALLGASWVDHLIIKTKSSRFPCFSHFYLIFRLQVSYSLLYWILS